MNEDIERKAFEEWFLNTDDADGVKYLLALEPNGEYAWGSPQGMWEAWQARAGLKLPEQKPIANIWFHRGMANFDGEPELSLLDDGKGTPIALFSSPPSPALRQLSDEDIDKIAVKFYGSKSTEQEMAFARYIEAALKEQP